jgi:hypothetical protein
MFKHTILLSVMIGIPVACTGQSATTPAPQASTQAPPASATASTEVVEAYEGKLADSDSQFRLELTKGGAATATWVDRSGDIRHYTGTYDGKEGIYVVSLRQVGADAHGGTMKLSLQQQGDREVGRYVMNGTSVQRSVSDLHLVEIETGPGGHRRHVASRAKSRHAAGSKSARPTHVHPPKVHPPRRNPD